MKSIIEIGLKRGVINPDVEQLAALAESVIDEIEHGHSLQLLWRDAEIKELKETKKLDFEYSNAELKQQIIHLSAMNEKLAHTMKHERIPGLLRLIEDALKAAYEDGAMMMADLPPPGGVKMAMAEAEEAKTELLIALKGLL